MSAQPAPANLSTEPGPHAPGQPAPGLHAADTHYYRQVLHELIDMGTGFARLLHQQATTPAHAAPQDSASQPAPTPAPDTAITVALAAAFDRIARAVRRSIALARSLADPVPPARDPAQHRAAARKRILREVEDVIQRTAPGSDHAASDDADADAADFDDASADALLAELHDRLDAPDLDDDISNRPVADIITEICRDLGLAILPGAHPWKRRTPADLEQLCARAAAPSRAHQPCTGPPVPATPQCAPQPAPSHPDRPPSPARPSPSTHPHRPGAGDGPSGAGHDGHANGQQERRASLATQAVVAAVHPGSIIERP